MKIALIGHGVMGKLVESVAVERNHSVETVIGESEGRLAADELAEKIAGCDVAVDFSVPTAVRRNLEACIVANVPLVEGTTGWDAERAEFERIVHAGNGSFIYGANFSIGVNLFYRITAFAAELFGKFSEYETFIEEQHHSRKIDAPSGTALRLKALVAPQFNSEVSIASTRAGNIPGTHRVGFDGRADQVLLEHTARDRQGFAAGAVTAAEWIIGRKGFYEFGEVMDEIIDAEVGSG